MIKMVNYICTFYLNTFFFKFLGVVDNIPNPNYFLIPIRYQCENYFISNQVELFTVIVILNMGS